MALARLEFFRLLCLGTSKGSGFRIYTGYFKFGVFGLSVRGFWEVGLSAPALSPALVLVPALALALALALASDPALAPASEGPPHPNQVLNRRRFEWGVPRAAVVYSGVFSERGGCGRDEGKQTDQRGISGSPNRASPGCRPSVSHLCFFTVFFGGFELC